MISKKLINQMNEYYGCEYIVTEKPKKQKLGKLIKKINKENAPPDGWSAADAVVKEDKPQPGKIYSLTGGPGTPSIAAGNTWAESVVQETEE